jgi:hypothetical protein
MSNDSIPQFSPVSSPNEDYDTLPERKTYKNTGITPYKVGYLADLMALEEAQEPVEIAHISTRPSSETDNLVGVFPNTVVEIQQKLHKVEDIEGVAYDLVLFANDPVEKVVAPYGMTWQDIEWLKEHSPVFRAAQVSAKKAVADDPHIGFRRVAEHYAHRRVHTLNELAGSALVEPKDRIKAISMLMDAANVMPQKAKEDGKTGTSVTLNFGGAMGQRLQQSMIVEAA